VSTASGSDKTGKGKILCVDDDEAVLKVLDVMLQSYGYGTVLAHNGQEGIDVFRQHKNDIVAGVLDLRMPLKNGLEVAREIRAESSDLPLIALSAYLGGAQKESITIKQCEEAGFSAHTTKPFAIEPFIATIDECVASYRKKHPTR
jgi:CheY-like chemotaxis protein